MKRYISLALCALAFIGLGSCNKVNETDFDGGSHSVTFRAQLGGDTRTGLALKFVPDWRETKIDNVHLFETYNGEVTEGEDVKMETPVDGSYEIAYFTADYGQMTIIVNPPSNAPATRADASGGFTYGGIVAQRDNSKKYFVPATQTPQASTLIDPNADFLVGHSLQSFSTEQSDKQVNLKFIRPVAISRLSIMNLEGTKVLSVKITSADALVGTAAYEDINFEDGTVAFTGGSKVLTLDYGTGTAIPAEGIFDAYFISLTGSKRIQKIEVTTDAGTFTKDLGEGKTLTFKVPDFKSIAVNMAGSGSGEPSTDLPQNVKFMRGTTVVTTDSYDLNSDNPYVSPTVTSDAPNPSLTYSSSDPGVATVSNAGVVTPIGVGETTISVSAGAVPGYLADGAEYTLTVTDSTPVPQNLSFNPTSLNVVLGQSFTKPQLDGAKTTVTYSSDKTDVVAVNASNGDLTIYQAGTAKITAIAAAEKVNGVNYAKGEASYEVTVTAAPVVAHYYAKVTETSEPVLNGQYIFVYEDGADAKVFKPVLSGTDRFATTNNALDATVKGGSWIASNDDVDACMVVLERQNGTNKAFDIYVPGVSTADTKYYFIPRMSSNNFVAKTGQGDYRPTFAVSADGVFTLSRDSYYFYYVSNAFNMTNSNPGTSSKLALYKYVEGENPGPVAQTLSFNPTSVTGKVGATLDAPALSGAKTTVTYSIDHPLVATVDANTGALELHAAGTATVTATAAAENGYDKGTATFDVTVTEDTPEPPVEETTYNYVSGNLSNGTYLIVSYDTNADPVNAVALFPNVVEKSWGGSSPANPGTCITEKEITLDGNNPITTTDAEIVGAEVELIASGSGWKVKAKKTGEYLVSPTSSNINHVFFSENEADGSVFNAGNVSGNGRSFTVSGTSNLYFFHSGSANGFTIRSGSTVSNLRFYKRAKKTQTLAFAGTSAEYDLADGGSWITRVPDLDQSGAETDVTYGSSNTAVAEVNPTTGEVTIPSTAKKGDTAVITATAVENEEYEEATANYTITISDSTPGVTVTYYKADEMVAGKEYLIVSNGFALRNADGSIAAVAVTVSDGTIKFDAESTDLWTATANGTAINMVNDSKYLRLQSSTLGIHSSLSSTATNNQWTYNAEDESLMVGSRYLYHSGSAFTTGSSFSDSRKAALYSTTAPLPAWEISFSRDAAEYDLYGNAWTSPGKPTLTTAATNVTYASSDETVATVSTTGDITALKKGTTTITATAVADATHKKAEASFTLTVVDSTPVSMVTVQLKKATALTAGQKYILVSNGHALMKDGEDAGVVDFNAGNLTISVPSASRNDVEWTLVEKTGSITRDNKWCFSNGDYFFGIAMNTNVSTYTYTVEVNNGRTVSTNVTIQDHNVDLTGEYIFYKGNSSSYYIYYNTSTGIWDNEKVNTSSGTPASTSKTALYVVDDGSTPDDPEPPTPSTSSTYTLISGQSELVSGTYLVVSVNNQNKVLKGGTGEGADRGAVVDATASPMSMSGNTITITGDASVCEVYEYVITRTDNTITLKGKLGYLKHDRPSNGGNSTTYIGFENTVSDSSTFTVNTNPGTNNSGANAVFFSIDYSGSKEYLYYNTGGYFKLGGSGKPDTASGKYGGVFLYKKN